jgi:hypothetical protein
MRFLQNMIRYDLGNAAAPLAIGVEFDRPFERQREKEAKIVRKLAIRHGTTEITFILDPNR